MYLNNFFYRGAQNLAIDSEKLKMTEKTLSMDPTKDLNLK